MNIPPIIKNISWLAAAEAAGRGLTFLTQMWLARTLLVTGYGSLAFVNAILAYLIMLVSGGMYVIGIRQTATANAKQTTTTFAQITAIKLPIAITITTIMLIWCALANNYPKPERIALAAGCLQLIAHAINCDWIFIAKQQMAAAASRTIIIGSLSAAGAIAFVRSPNDMPIYVAIVSAATAITYSWMLKTANQKFQLLKNFKNELTNAWQHPKTLAKLAKESTPLLLSYILITVMAQFGTIYITAKNGYYDTGLLAACIKITSLAIIPSAVFQYAFAPKVAAITNLNERQTMAKQYITAVLAGGAFIACTLATFPNVFIEILFGTNFQNATPMLQLLAGYVFFIYMSQAALTFFFYWGLQRQTVTGYAIGTAVCIASTTLLVELYGSWGLAMAMVLQDGALAIAFFIMLRHTLGKLNICPVLRFLPVAATTCIIGRLFNCILPQNIYFQIIGIIIAAILFVITMWKTKIIDKKL